MQQDTCSVCLDPLDGQRDEHRLSCSHAFHAACLLPWVLGGNRSCPSCRATETQPESSIPAMALYARASYLRNTVGRRRNAPRELMALVRRVRDAESHYTRCASEATQYRRTHAAVFCQARRLASRKWSVARKVRERKRALGLFACPEHPLPHLSVGEHGAWGPF